VRRNLERFVGSIFSWLFLASLSQIISAWLVPFVFSVVEDPLCVRSPLLF